MVTPGLHSECPALSTPSRGISYERATKTVLHCPVILGPSLMFQKLILFEATVRWIGLSFGVAIKEHIPRKIQLLIHVSGSVPYSSRGREKKRERKERGKDVGEGKVERKFLRKLKRLNTQGFNHQYALILNKNCQ